ncbi:MAG: hypothetical protein J5958_06560 [Clostridia bacterium]|nr:hypothetical protein [Clostridia bacterium]
MAIERIDQVDLVGKLIRELSDRPTNPVSAGGDGLTSDELKQRYDALSLLVKDRLNALIDALTGANEEDLLAESLKVSNDQTLSAFVSAITAAVAAKRAKETPESDGSYAYAVTKDGTTVTDGKVQMTDSPTADTLAMRNESGQLKVADGSALGDAVNKGQLNTVEAKADAKYEKPGTGIPADDLAEAVQTLLGKADTALQEHQDISGKADKTALNALADIVKGKKKATVKASYSALVTALNAADDDEFVEGDDIFIKTAEVPDVWISGVEDTSTEYTYTTDEDFIDALNAGTLQVGYYTLAPLETEKPDLSGLADADDVEDIIDGTTQVGDAAHADEADKADEAAHATYSDFATQLYTEREIEDSDEACPPTVFGTVGGTAEVQSGLMKFPEVRGKTIKWNQLCKDPTFATASMWGSGATIANNKATLSGTGSSSQAFDSGTPNITHNTIPWTADHIYIIAATITTTHATTHTQFRTYDGSSFGNPGGGFALDVGTTRKTIVWKYNKNTTENGRIYFYANLDTTGAGIGLPVGETMTVEDLQIVDLTMAFGITDASYAPKMFLAQYPKTRYAYNPETLLSSKSASMISRQKNQCPGLDEYFRVIPGETYEVSGITEGGYLQEYDANKTLLKTSSEITSATDITLDGRTAFCKLQATTYTIPFCYILWSTPNEAPEAYSATTVTLPNLTLRSLGDIYDVAYQTGGGKRRVGERAYESGDENDPDVWTDGTTTLYPLLVETNISLLENPGWDEYIPVDNFGTIQFTQDPAQDIPVPQAYFIRYTVNLVEFLDSLYVRCGGDASKIALVE